MRVFVGDTRSGAMIRRLRMHGWGRMFQARTGGSRFISLYPGEEWALDNGAYMDWKAERPFDERDFTGRLSSITVQVMRGQLPEPYLAVLPDLPTKGEESLEYSLSWLNRLDEAASWRWYLAVQDEMPPESVDAAHEEHGFAGIFLGGSNGYKSTAAFWRDWTNERRLPLHYARAGTANAVAHALEVQANSIDSAFPLWTLARFEHFAECIKLGPPQYRFLFDEAG
jgi:hypothetical protein